MNLKFAQRELRSLASLTPTTLSLFSKFSIVWWRGPVHLPLGRFSSKCGCCGSGAVSLVSVCRVPTAPWRPRLGANDWLKLSGETECLSIMKKCAGMSTAASQGWVDKETRPWVDEGWWLGGEQQQPSTKPQNARDWLLPSSLPPFLPARPPSQHFCQATLLLGVERISLNSYKKMGGRTSELETSNRHY